jgi:radical SAM superfamily enzyme YgiQ (UPF0313 family)
VANVLLISVYDRNAYGLRLMSSALKARGHQCHMIFLKRYDTNPTYKLELEVGEYPWMGIGKSGQVFKYASNSHISEKELDLLTALVAEIGPDIIGTTVNTPLRSQSNRVTSHLKKHFDIPIIWGGYDPTVNSEDCLELCDYTCIGEGDQTMQDIADHIDQGLPFDDIKNLAYLESDSETLAMSGGGRAVYNDRHLVVPELDEIPWRDNSPENKYFIEDDKLVRNYPVLSDKAAGVYQTMSSRGCPYQCEYCCEATMKEMYAGEKFLRRRSAENLVAELEEYKKDFPLTQIQFEDEIFAMGAKWLEQFAPLYKEKIGVPFVAYIYPTRNIERILTLLKDAGLTYACLALESGSERINKDIFRRVYDRELFLHTAAVCRKLDIKFYTDVITYNPYETEEDLIHTLDVLMGIGGGFEMAINKLFVLPGTEMAKRMEADGIEIRETHKDMLFNYYCRLYWITSFKYNMAPTIRFIQRFPIFKKHPRLINPVVLEWLVSPPSAIRSSFIHYLPGGIAHWLRSLSKRYKARKRGAGSALTDGAPA